jgi:hypothetical protein
MVMSIQEAEFHKAVIIVITFLHQNTKPSLPTIYTGKIPGDVD